MSFLHVSANLFFFVFLFLVSRRKCRRRDAKKRANVVNESGDESRFSGFVFVQGFFFILKELTDPRVFFLSSLFDPSRFFLLPRPSPLHIASSVFLVVSPPSFPSFVCLPLSFFFFAVACASEKEDALCPGSERTHCVGVGLLCRSGTFVSKERREMGIVFFFFGPFFFLAPCNSTVCFTLFVVPLAPFFRRAKTKKKRFVGWERTELQSDFLLGCRVSVSC